MTLQQRLVKRLQDLDYSIEDLQDQLADAQRRRDDYEELLATAGQCLCGSTWIDHEEDCGWCEACGRVYYYDGCDVLWVNPAVDDLESLEWLCTRTYKAVEAIWNNEAVADQLACQLRKQIAEQKKWIAEHGGDLGGYIKRYGVPGTEHCYGNGGNAIYHADINELHRLEAKLCEVTSEQNS